MVRRSSFEPLLFSLVETLYHSILPKLNITRYPFAIHSKRIGRYPLVSVDQVQFCGELLFFFLIFFFFFLLFLPWVPGRAHFLPITLFFFFPSFPPLFTSFFPSFFCPTLISSSHFPPAFHPYFILFPFLNLSMFFSSPVHQSNSSQFLDHR